MSDDLRRAAGRVLFNQWSTVRGNEESLTLLERGRGVHVWDEQGRRLLDTLSGYWCVSAGYGRPEIARRVQAQLRQLSYGALDWRAHRPAVELAQRLLALAPAGMERIFFCSGGSEGVEAALRLSRAYWRASGRPDRDVVLYREGSYHGATLGALSVTGRDFARSPGLGACAAVAVGRKDAMADVDELERKILELGAPRVAAFIAEPVPAFDRVVVPPQAYWPRLKAMLERHGVLLVFDEVVTGMGRTGPWFAAQHWGLSPDLIVLAKGLSGGYAPLGAVLIGEKVASGLRDAVLPGYTFGGHPAACAAALGTIEALEGLLPSVPERGAQLLEGLRRAAAGRPFAGVVAGLGLLASIELSLDAQAQRRLGGYLREEGLLCLAEDSVLPIAPPLCLTAAQARALAKAVGRAFEKLSRDAAPVHAGA